MSSDHNKKIVVASDTPIEPRHFIDLKVGDSCIENLVLTEKSLMDFADLSGDRAPVHFSDSHAQQLGYSGRIVHGLLATVRFSRLLGMYLPGPLSVIHGIQFKYPKPVKINSSLTYTVQISSLREAMRIVVLDLMIECAGEVCVKGNAQCMLK